MEILKMTTSIWLFIFLFGLPCVLMMLAPWSSRCLWLAAITPLRHHTNIFPLCPAGNRRSSVIICRSVCVCVWQRVINKEIKDKNETRSLRMHDRRSQTKSLWGKSREAAIHRSHASYLSAGFTNSGWLTLSVSEQADRILVRPVQKIKAGQLALMPALFFGEWRAWRTAGLLFCPVLELLFSGCTAALSWFDWRTSIHLIVLFRRGALWTGKTPAYILRCFQIENTNEQQQQQKNTVAINNKMHK